MSKLRRILWKQHSTKHNTQDGNAESTFFTLSIDSNEKVVWYNIQQDLVTSRKKV